MRGRGWTLVGGVDAVPATGVVRMRSRFVRWYAHGEDASTGQFDEIAVRFVRRILASSLRRIAERSSTR